MNVKQFCEKHQDYLFARFFFNIQYDYGVTEHYALYIKYDPNNPNKSFEMFKYLMLLNCSLQLNNKVDVKGYDPNFLDSKTLLSQLSQDQKNNMIVNQPEGQYYIVQQFKL